MLVILQVGLFYCFRVPHRGQVAAYAYFRRKGETAELDRDLALLFPEEAELETNVALLHSGGTRSDAAVLLVPCRHKG